MLDRRDRAGPRRVAATRLEVRDLTVRYGATTAVTGVDLDVAPGGLGALLGPSGGGKSTVLAAVAGLRRPETGEVLLDGTAVTSVAPERRPVALVFQKPLLFEHLSVAQNVGFALRMARVPRRQARAAVEEMLERVRLAGYGDRRPAELSGGQEQRVALARALVQRPRVLLLDEPFSQLDPDLRAEMRGLLRELHADLPVTTLVVTHDRDEAVELADRVTLLLDGRVAGSGTPERIYTRPSTLALARFFGAANELPGRVHDGVFHGPVGLRVPTAVAAGDGVLVVRPEAVAVVDDADPPHAPDADRGRTSLHVTGVRFAGTHLVVTGQLADGHPLTVHVPVGTPVTPGARMPVRLPADRCTVLPRETGGPGEPA